MMLRAGALYYAIVTSIIFSLVSLSLLLCADHVSQGFRLAEQQRRLRQLQLTGLDLLLSDTKNQCANTQLELAIPGAKSDGVVLERGRWGLFEWARVASSVGGMKEERQLFLGAVVDPETFPALRLSPARQPLSLCGNTRIKGHCKIPGGVAKRAHIEGKNFEGDQLILGSIEATDANWNPPIELPDPDFLSAEKWLNDLPADPNTNLKAFAFGGTPAIIELTTSIVSGVFKGHVILRSDVPLIVPSDCKLEDVLVIAPSIVLRSGFSGSAQFFAFDSLIVEPDVSLTYPSALVLLDRPSSKDQHLTIKGGCSIEGAVVSASNSRYPTLVTLAAGSSVFGIVQAGDRFQLKGSVHGSVSASSFYLRTRSAVYQNHLLDAKINAVDLPFGLVLPCMTSFGSHTTTVAKWL